MPSTRQVVNGSNIWNQLADGTFVTDVYCDTPNFNRFSPPIPVCKYASGIKGDDYPYKDAPTDPEVVDPWNFYCTECTSFVAWRMNQLGVNFTNGMSGPNGAPPNDDPVYGNGEHWADHARTLGFRVDNTASAGALAHLPSNVTRPATVLAAASLPKGTGCRLLPARASTCRARR